MTSTFLVSSVYSLSGIYPRAVVHHTLVLHFFGGGKIILTREVAASKDFFLKKSLFNTESNKFHTYVISIFHKFRIYASGECKCLKPQGSVLFMASVPSTEHSKLLISIW